MSRLNYVRFEMQVDPLPNRKMVKDVPSYAEVKQKLTELGFKHNGKHACDDSTMGSFSKAIREMECTFCRKLPCREGGVPPLGPNPAEVVRRKGSWSSLVTKTSSSVQVAQQAAGQKLTITVPKIASSQQQPIPRHPVEQPRKAAGPGEPTSFEQETMFMEKIL